MHNSRERERPVLRCKRVRFYSQADEIVFFEWVKRLECVERAEGMHDEIHLHLTSAEIGDDCLRELLAVFYRYRISMQQLKRFLTKHNEPWFYRNEQSYWHKKVFGARKSEQA
jgi:hypothetical protein